MTPARLQAPPLASGASARITAGPPAAANLLQFAAGKESDPPAVGRPERLPRAGCSRERVALPGRQIAHEQLRAGLRLMPAHAMRRPSGDTAGADHRPVSGRQRPVEARRNSIGHDDRALPDPPADRRATLPPRSARRAATTAVFAQLRALADATRARGAVRRPVGRVLERPHQIGGGLKPIRRRLLQQARDDRVERG